MKRRDLMKVVWVAAEMRAGAAYAHAAVMMAVLPDKAHESRAGGRHPTR